MHTYNTNPPTSVKQHLQQWLSKCCTNLLTKELKHLCTRTQLDVKAMHCMHSHLQKTKLTWYLLTTHTQKKIQTNSPCFKKKSARCTKGCKNPTAKSVVQKKFPNPWQAGTEETTKQCAVKKRSSAEATHLIHTNFT